MISQMEFLRKELLTISNAIRKMMREQRYKTNYYLLRTIPGIGPLTAASILVEIGDVKRFETFYHLNSFVGLLPMEHSSGQSENKLSLTVRKHRQLQKRPCRKRLDSQANRSCYGAVFPGTNKTKRQQNSDHKNCQKTAQPDTVCIG